MTNGLAYRKIDTMTTKQARWQCPQCQTGILAPTKPRKNDTRRYCLPCSAKQGKLVERIAPALQAKREKRAAYTTTKTNKKRQKERKQKQTQKHQTQNETKRKQIIHQEAQRIWELMHDWHKGKPLPQITIARGQNRGKQYGHAYTHRNKIQINVDQYQTPERSKRVWAVLTHELAHCACPPINTGGKKDNTHHETFYRCIRHVWNKRWKLDISFHKVTHWGYTVDHIIQNQGYPKVTFTLPNAKNTQPPTPKTKPQTPTTYPNPITLRIPKGIDDDLYLEFIERYEPDNPEHTYTEQDTTLNKALKNAKLLKNGGCTAEIPHNCLNLIREEVLDNFNRIEKYFYPNDYNKYDRFIKKLDHIIKTIQTQPTAPTLTK